MKSSGISGSKVSPADKAEDQLSFEDISSRDDTEIAASTDIPGGGKYMDNRGNGDESNHSGADFSRSKAGEHQQGKDASDQGTSANLTHWQDALQKVSNVVHFEKIKENAMTKRQRLRRQHKYGLGLVLRCMSYLGRYDFLDARIDPYVKITMMPWEVHARTTTRKDVDEDSDCAWNEMLQMGYPVDPMKEEHQSISLLVEVWDEDVGMDDLVGQFGPIDLSKIHKCPGRAFPIVCGLTDTNDNPCGTLHLEIIFEEAAPAFSQEQLVINYRPNLSTRFRKNSLSGARSVPTPKRSLGGANEKDTDKGIVTNSNLNSSLHSKQDSRQESAQDGAGDTKQNKDCRVDVVGERRQLPGALEPSGTEGVESIEEGVTKLKRDLPAAGQGDPAAAASREGGPCEMRDEKAGGIPNQASSKQCAGDSKEELLDVHKKDGKATEDKLGGGTLSMLNIPDTLAGKTISGVLFKQKPGNKAAAKTKPMHQGAVNTEGARLSPHLPRLKVRVRRAHGIRMFSEVERVEQDPCMFITACVAMATYFGLGIAVYSQWEGWSFWDSFYFVVVCITTVGYGDLHPTTTHSRWFTCFYLYFGVVIIASAAGFIFSVLLENNSKSLLDQVKQQAAGSLPTQKTRKRRRKKGKTEPPTNESGAESVSTHRHHSQQAATDPLPGSVGARTGAAGAPSGNERSNTDTHGQSGRPGTSGSGDGGVDAEGRGEADSSSSQRPSMSEATRIQKLPVDAETERMNRWKERLMPLLRSLTLLVIFKAVGVIFLVLHEDFTPSAAFYLACVTMTSVGFGEIFPKTPNGRIFSTFWILFSTVLVANSASKLADLFLKSKQDEISKKILNKTIQLAELHKLDADQNGEINELEYILHMLVKMRKVDEASIQELRDRFAALDVNKDGVLSAADLE